MDDDLPIMRIPLREFVLTRGRMFIGREWDNAAIYKLIRWLSDYAVNPEAANASTRLMVVIEHENEVSIIYDGRGLPVERIQVEQSVVRPKIEHILSGLFTTNPLPAYYQAWGYLNYLGYVINAVSERLEIETQYDGVWYQVVCGKGEILEHVHPIGEAVLREKGIRLTFKPDPAFFPEFRFDFDQLITEMKELKHEYPAIEFLINDRRIAHSERL